MKRWNAERRNGPVVCTKFFNYKIPIIVLGCMNTVMYN